MDDANRFRIGRESAIRYEAFVRPIMAPFVGALIEATRPLAGESLLDVACGTGFVARAAAPEVGPSGHITACDLNPVMLAVGAEAAEAAGASRPLIDWIHAPADDLPFDEHSFDVVLCQQGLQFVPDLDATLASLARVLRPGGRLATTTWAALAHSPYMQAQYEGITDMLGSAGTETYLAAFALSAERLGRAAEGVGLVDVEVTEIQCPVTLPPMPAYAADQLSALPWGASVAERGPNSLAEVAASITDRLSGHADADGRVTVPFASLLLTARQAGV